MGRGIIILIYLIINLSSLMAFHSYGKPDPDSEKNYIHTTHIAIIMYVTRSRQDTPIISSIHIATGL